MDATTIPTRSILQQANRRVLLAAGVVGLALVPGMAVTGSGERLHAAVGVLALVGSVIAAFLGGSAFVRAESASAGRAAALAWSTTLAWSYAIVCTGAVLSVPVGERWDDWREGPTREWCERLADRLRAFAAERGHLPATLDELGDTRQPWYAKEVRYDPQGVEFTLSFGELGFLGVDECTTGYDSRRDQWWSEPPPPYIPTTID